MREASGYRTKIHALRCSCIEHRVIESSVFHGREINGIAHLPAGDILQKRGAGNAGGGSGWVGQDRKSTRLNSSHSQISYAVFCLKKKKNTELATPRHLHCQPPR